LGIRAIIWKRSTGKIKYDLGGMCNGILVGLVSITAPCATVETGSALAIGVFGALLYQMASSLLQRLKIDDPLDAFPVHGVGGAWGVLAAAIFDFGAGFDYANGRSGFSCHVDADGNCMSGAWGKLFIANIVEILGISLWVILWSLMLLVPMRITGILVAQPQLQQIGMDAAKHSPTKAYCLEPEAQDV